mgnify:CR=1 FL=1|jgi:hypothetical protein
MIVVLCRELYRLALVDTPLASYFSSSIKAEDLDELNIELIRNVLYKVKFRLHFDEVTPEVCSRNICKISWFSATKWIKTHVN